MPAIEDRPIPPPLSFQGCTPREWQALARATAGLVRPTYTANGTISRALGDHGQSHVSIAEGAIMTDVETALASCRALINQINAGLSAKEPFVDASSATELIFYLERAASALKKSFSRSRERAKMKIAPNYH